MRNRIKIVIIITLLLFAALALLQTKQLAQTQNVTAGQKFKNIKVLNDMPADQIGNVMNIIAASLGKDCNFCHVGQDFEKDDKKEKASAREMMKMTFEINKNHFNGRTEVTCNACHNGHEHPQAAPNLMPAAEEDRPKQPDVKPTIDQILGKYNTALGGKENLAKIRSRYIKATRVEPNGKTEVEEVWQKEPGLILVTTLYPPNFTITEGFNGTTGWKMSNKQPIDLKKDEIEQIRREGQISANVDLKTVYTKLDVRFVDKLDGREVYVVLGTTANNQRERLYFDVLTGLLVRRTASVPTVLGPFQYQVDYFDYKDFGGVKLPTTTHFAMPNIRWTRKIRDVKTNVSVDDAKFMSPAE